MQNLIRELLIKIGENPEREGLHKTPYRFEKSFEFLTSGYKQDISKIINCAVFNEKYDEMVIVKDIEMYSLCEHHLLPFYGKCHVAYMPNGKVIGLSKIPRIVDVFAKRLQVQERLTNQIAETLMEYLNPQGVGVVIEARHLCMMMRGVQKQNTVVSTSALLGVFRSNQSTRDEFMHLINAQRYV
jgi:GTP cyclohydrolase I